jgi:hypothetical protein
MRRFLARKDLWTVQGGHCERALVEELVMVWMKEIIGFKCYLNQQWS